MRNKGITLIALVITIIVLLILAGVTISLVVGDNGIISKAKEAKSKAKEAKSKTKEEAGREQIELAIASMTADRLGDITLEDIAEHIHEELKIPKEDVIPNGNPIESVNVIVGDYEYKIDDKFQVSIEGPAGLRVRYTLEPEGYTDGEVVITFDITVPEGEKLASITPLTEGVTKGESSTKFVITEAGEYVFQIMTDGQKEKTVTIPIHQIDKEGPTGTIEVEEGKKIKNGTIKAKITVEDNQSGVDLENTKWLLSTKSTEETEANWTKVTVLISKEEEIETGKITGAGPYYIHVLAKDNIGNTREIISEKIVIESGYGISTPQDLQNVKNDLAGNYYVLNDIEMQGFNFTTIDGVFTGTIDGQGYTINNLTINSGERQTGIFKEVGNGTYIKNLLIKNAKIYSTNFYAGVIAGETEFEKKSVTITFEKVGITGTVTGKGVGGFLGFTSLIETANPGLRYTDCYSKVSLIGYDGYNYNASGFSPGYANEGTSVFTNCYAVVTTSIKTRIGAFLSTNFAKWQTLNNCYYDKNVFSQGVSLGNCGIGRTTKEMGDQTKYTGWDFKEDENDTDYTWYIGEDGYPELYFKK